MKKILVVFALFTALIFVVGCGGGSKSVYNTDPGDTVTDNDAGESGSTDTEPGGGDSQPDESDTTPDNGDTTPCNDADSGDIVPDSDDGDTTNENPDNLPECSPTSATPCFDPETGLIWSAKSENKMPQNDAVNYCQNLTEGDFNDWRLPSIAVLKTLVQNCSSAKCTEDYTGIYSKFGDTVYLWSSSESEELTALSIYFSDASTQAVTIDVNVRCVRRESESRETNCTGLIENSVWNTASQITQTWDWETATWIPSSEGSYNTNASSSECRFKCDSNSFHSFWDGSLYCGNPCKYNPCNRIGETGTCIGKSANEYSCECEDNYEWISDSNKCMKNPCRNNPCNIPNSTGTCNTVSETRYTCECEEKYFFDFGSGKCLNPCESNPCNAVTHSTHECTTSSSYQYTCECEENYYWWGKEKGCLDTKPLTLGEICTGQTKCYNNTEEITCPSSSSTDFYGQDAQYTSKCTAQSFTVQTISSQNVVLDNNTGLMWQQTIPTDEYKWDDAISYCDDLIYAGYNDWRLPTPQELLTIVDNSRYDPAIDTTYFPNTPGSAFWSSSTYYVSYTNYAWYVRFSDGVVGYGSKSPAGNYHVRCVRGESLPSSTFETTTVKGDVVVTDTKTGLIWQKKTYETRKTWQKALDYCEKLTYAGYSDWRLPDKNELASLVNYEKCDPDSDFPDMPSQYFWSSSTSSGYTDLAWSVNFYHWGVGNVTKTSSRYVRCVR